jgi:hypothetical protein
MKTEKFSAENKSQQIQFNETVECKQTYDMQIIPHGLCFSWIIWLWLLSQNGSS